MRRHDGGVFSEWAAPVKSSVADLHTGVVFGPIWLLEELGIEFKETPRGVYHHLGWCSYGESAMVPNLKGWLDFWADI